MFEKLIEYKEMREAIQKIRSLHSPANAGGCSDLDCCSPSDSEEFCSECQNYEYPCTTLKILDGEI
jgi:hypothetical protein